MSEGVQPIPFRSVFRALGMLFLALLLVFGGLHLFIFYRANALLKAFVEEVSDGNYTANSQSLRFAYLPFRIKAARIHFYPLDTSGSHRLYDLRADSLQMKLSSLVPLLFYNSLDVKEVRLVKPMIEVLSDANVNDKGGGRFNIPIKEIQDGLLKSLDLLRVNKCIIKDGGFKLMQRQNNQYLAINHIDLTIDSLLASKKGLVSPAGDTVMAYIILNVNRPDIQIPDTNYLVDVDRLMVDTRKNIFEIDELRFSRNKKSRAFDSLKLSSISLRGLNWDYFLNRGIIEFDSVRVKNGLAEIDLTDRFIFQKRTEAEKKTQQANVSLPIILHHATVQQVSYKLRSRRKEGTFTILLDGDSLLVKEFYLLDSAVQPVQVGSLSLNVRNYNDEDDKKTYKAGFDRLTIQDDDLNIINYKIVPIRRKGFSANNLVDVPSLRLYNYNFSRLLQGQLEASRLDLMNPTIVIDVMGKKQLPIEKAGGMQPFFEALHRLQPTLDIDQLGIHNGKIILQPRNSSTDTIVISQLSTDIDVERLLSANSIEDLMRVTEGIQSDGFFITGNRFQFKISGALASPVNNYLGMNRLQGTLESGLVLDLDHVQIIGKSGEMMIPVDGRLNLSRVSVASGDVMITSGRVSLSGEGRKKAPVLNIDSLNTGNLSMTYINKKGLASTIRRLALDITGLHVDNANVSWIDALIEGAELGTGSGRSNLKTGFWYGSLPGTFTLEQVKVWPQASASFGITLDIPKVEIRNNIRSLNLNRHSFDETVVFQPRVRWTADTAKEKNESYESLPALYIPKLTILNPDLDGDILTNGKTKRRLTVQGGDVRVTDLDLFYSYPSTVLSRSFSFFSPKTEVEVNNNWTVRPSSVRFAGSNLLWKKGELPSGFADSAEIEGVGSIPVFKDSLHRLDIGTAGITGWPFPMSTDSFIFKLTNGPEWWVKGVNYAFQGKRYQLNVSNASATRNNRAISFDSLTLKPLMDRDSFWRSWPFQKDFITLKLGSGYIHDFQPLHPDIKKGARIRSIDVQELELIAARDKQLPDDTVTYRPLLAGQITSIPFDLRIDSVMMQNSSVYYHEISPKSKLEGTLSLTDLHGGIFNVLTRGPYPADSLVLDVRGRLFNTAPIQLRYVQPYQDSLQSFRFTVGFGKWQMNAANTLLAPLNSIEFRRGVSDTMWLTAYGNQQFAYGWMGHRYQKLRLGLLKNGYDRNYFMSGATNAFTNMFLINNNRGNATPFFVNRVQNKMVFNYWGRILREGMMGNMGMPGKKKQARKAMRKEHIPAHRSVP